jgi:hypothetical protein
MRGLCYCSEFEARQMRGLCYYSEFEARQMRGLCYCSELFAIRFYWNCRFLGNWISLHTCRHEKLQQ